MRVHIPSTHTYYITTYGTIITKYSGILSISIGSNVPPTILGNVLEKVYIHDWNEVRQCPINLLVSVQLFACQFPQMLECPEKEERQLHTVNTASVYDSDVLFSANSG